jgi:hypothetical protein
MHKSQRHAIGWTAWVRFPAVQDFSTLHSVQTGSGVHPASVHWVQGTLWDNFNFWRMNPLMFSRAWGFSTTTLSTFHNKCIIGWATRHTDWVWGSACPASTFSWYEPIWFLIHQIKCLCYGRTRSWWPDQSHPGSCSNIWGQPRTLVCTMDSIQCCCEACMQATGGNYEQLLRKIM